MQKFIAGDEISVSYELYADTVYRVCLMYFKQNTHDIEDAIQTTFLKRIKCKKEFKSSEHEKAWLIVTASNVCKDMLKLRERKNVSIEKIVLADTNSEPELDEVLGDLMALPHKYKIALYLYYYEQYQCKQIAQAMHRSEGAVWNYLHVGRNLLRTIIEGGCQ